MEELFNVSLGDFIECPSCSSEKEAGMPRMGLVRLLLTGMKKRRSLHNHFL